MQGLRALGYVEGQNVTIDYRSADGRPERFRDLARELVRLHVDVIVTRGTPAALGAQLVTATIPIVMASSGEPVAAGIVASLKRPGGNVTGFYTMAPAEIGATRLRLLKEALPAVARVGILWNPEDMQAPLIARETERVARSMAVQVTSLEVKRRRDGLDQVFEGTLRPHVLRH